MKRYGWTGILLLLVLIGCDSTTREARQMVKRAELLADTLPDSTACLIDSVLRMPASFSERERMDIALLQAEALFGEPRGDVHNVSPLMDDDFFDDHATLSTSPELERASAYYAHKKQYAKAAHAALYSGFVQQHYNEKEAAMRSFKEAEEYGQLAVDSLTVALAEYWMGKMLYNEGSEQEALKSFVTSKRFIGNRNIDLAIIENSKAVAYILMRQHDSAESCLRHSLFYAEKGNNEKVKHKIYNNYSVLYRIQGKNDQAIGYLQQMTNNPCFDNTEKIVLLLNLSKAYFKMKEMDSVAKYIQQIEGMLLSVNVKKETEASVHELLSQFAESQNDASLALQHRERHESILYDLMFQRQEQTLYRTKRQFDYESLQNKTNKEHARMQRIIACGIALLLCIMAIFFYRSSIRNKKEAEVNANLFHFMQQNKTLTQNNMEHEKKILDTMQQLSDMYYARFKTMQKLSFSIENPKNKIALKDLEKQVFGEGEHWDGIKEVLDALYPGLWASITLKYPEMNEMERRVFMLSRLKLSRVEEAALLGISTSVLDKLRTRVHKIVEQDKKQ